MKISVLSDNGSGPVMTPAGLVPKTFTAEVLYGSKSEFNLEVEVEIQTRNLGTNEQIGAVINKMTFIRTKKALIGVTSTHLRSIQVRQILEACIHAAAAPTVKKKTSGALTNEGRVLEKQLRAAKIVMENPGEPAAKLVAAEFGITIASARNLITRARKSGFLMAGRTTNPAELNPQETFLKMSDHGAYIDQIIYQNKGARK
jgi:hypothetical protein